MKGLGVGKVIYSLLKNNEAVNAQIAGRIFPIVADEGTKFPFITYTRRSFLSSYSKDDEIDETATVEVNIVSDEYFKGINIANLVRNATERQRGTVDGITYDPITLIDAQEDFLQNAFVQTLIFKITTD